MTKDEKLKKALKDAFDEFIKATSKYGKFNSSHEGYAVLLEEVDELWEEVKANAPKERLREECIQVAAMALRFLVDCCTEETAEG